MGTVPSQQRWRDVSQLAGCRWGRAPFRWHASALLACYVKNIRVNSISEMREHGGEDVCLLSWGGREMQDWGHETGKATGGRVKDKKRKQKVTDTTKTSQMSVCLKGIFFLSYCLGWKMLGVRNCAQFFSLFNHSLLHRKCLNNRVFYPLQDV